MENYVRFDPHYRALPHMSLDFNATWSQIRDLFWANPTLKSLTAKIDATQKPKGYFGVPQPIMPGEPELIVNENLMGNA